MIPHVPPLQLLLHVALLSVLTVPSSALRAVVVTDVHLDPLYDATASKSCFCRSECRGTAGTHPQLYGQAGCDSPSLLLDSVLFAAARAFDPPPELLIMLGDHMAHRLKQHPGTLGVVFPNVTARIAQAFPSVRRACVVALGNTDVYPDYSIHYTEPAYFAPHARAIAAHCDLTDAAVETLRTRGFYAVGPTDVEGRGGGPRIVVLNTGVYSTDPAGPPLNTTLHPDPHAQFAWLERELAAAAAAGSKVLIVGHIPPTLDSYYREPLWQEYYAATFWALLHRYPSAVGGLLFGHIHTTQFRVWGAGTAALDGAPPLFTLPAVSPLFGNNPSFSSLTLDESDGYRMTDYQIYAADLAAQTSALTNASTSGLDFMPLFDSTGRIAPSYYKSQSARAKAITLDNRRHSQLATFMDDFPAPREDGERAWDTFHAEYATNGSMLSDRSCTGNRQDDTVGDCKVCEGGCRSGWICLLLQGLSLSEYDRCLEAFEMHAARTHYATAWFVQPESDGVARRPSWPKNAATSAAGLAVLLALLSRWVSTRVHHALRGSSISALAQEKSPVVTDADGEDDDDVTSTYKTPYLAL